MSGSRARIKVPSAPVTTPSRRGLGPHPRPSRTITPHRRAPSNDAASEVVEVLEQAVKGRRAIDRSGVNAWDNPAFVTAIAATGRRKLVMAGLYTEICLSLTALSAIAAGYEVYALVDVSGGVSQTAHDAALQRLTQAGVVPVTWMAVLTEWQRDWTRTETIPGLFEVARAHGGAYALQSQLLEARGDGS